jgi:glycosyltransferase involved in cell wall biosynthesis
LKFFFVFNTKFLQEYDVVIFSGDCLAGARNVGKNTKAYYYCHTPPRYLFDQQETYLAKVPKAIRWFYNILTNWYKKLYFRDLKKMDAVFTNSTNTKNRLKHFTQYNAEIIYPPVDLSRFVPSEIRGDYYYSWARLSAIKRVDKIVEAFARMPDKKLIFSYGINDPEKEKILETAKKYPNIEAIQSPDDPELIKLISESIATIYIPVDEDFGMTPVESMACGVPVI